MNHHDHDHADDLGLTHDLRQISHQLAERRRLLGWMMAGSTALLLPGCNAEDDLAADSGGSAGSPASGSCIADPEETNGPFPSDGTNRANGSLSNVLLDSGVIRSDIRSSFGVSANTAPGVPLVLDISIVDTNSVCAPLSGWAVYVWHCTRDGGYTLYSNGLQNENYLRGMQVSDANGRLSFTTIFPGCYDGRYPHIHFEVYRSLSAATGFANRALCSQMAMPRNICSTVYAGASGYSASVASLARISVASDNVFGNNSDAQIAAQTPTLSGSINDGFSGSIVVGVAA